MQPAMDLSAGGVLQAALFASGAGKGRFRSFGYRAIGTSRLVPDAAPRKG
jgi:hypothetical protein